MKIGILTYHRTLNYGACLQALATRLILEDMGHDVYYVDYWPDYQKNTYAVFSFKRLFCKGLEYKEKIKYVVDSIRYWKARIGRHKEFNFFLDQHIKPFCRPIGECYDVVVYGSDQIWRKQRELGDYNPIYFAQNNFNTQKHVAFSASMGVLPKTEKEKRHIVELLSNFNQIAVRENDLLLMLKEIGILGVSKTIDPTLLIDAKIWDKTLSPEPYSGPKYILVYALHPEVFNMQTIYRFANERGLSVRVLLGKATHSDTYNEITTAGPAKFLELIKNAEYIFSSSFHGVVFSIIFNKEFYASFSENSNRVKTLLDAVGISNRLIPANSQIPSLERIDYTVVREKILLMRKDSLTYLSSI